MKSCSGESFKCWWSHQWCRPRWWHSCKASPALGHGWALLRNRYRSSSRRRRRSSKKTCPLDLPGNELTSENSWTVRLEIQPTPQVWYNAPSSPLLFPGNTEAFCVWPQFQEDPIDRVRCLLEFRWFSSHVVNGSVSEMGLWIEHPFEALDLLRTIQSLGCDALWLLGF